MKYEKRYLSGMLAAVGMNALAAINPASAQGLPAATQGASMDTFQGFSNGINYGIGIALDGNTSKSEEVYRNAAAGKGPAYLKGLQDGIKCVVDGTKAKLKAQNIEYVGQRANSATPSGRAQAMAAGESRTECQADATKRFTDSFKP